MAVDVRRVADRVAGTAIERWTSAHHACRLGKLGRSVQRTPPDDGRLWKPGDPPARPGNALDVLIDGAAYFPALERAIRGARRRVLGDGRTALRNGVNRTGGGGTVGGGVRPETLIAIYRYEGPAYWARMMNVPLRPGFGKPRSPEWTRDRIHSELERFCAGREAFPTEREFVDCWATAALQRGEPEWRHRLVRRAAWASSPASPPGDAGSLDRTMRVGLG